MAHTEFDEPSSSEAGRTAELLADYLERLERGETPQLDELVAAYPHASRELLEDLQKLGALHLAALTAGDDLLAAHAADKPLLAHAPPLGDFRLIRPLGQGGMGVVYEAEQVSLARRVALKTLRASAALDPKQIARFRREAYAAASLDHPGIASVYAVGSDRGVHYYAMQYVDGQSLAGVIRQLRDAEPTASRPSTTPPACPATSSLAALRVNGRREYFRRVAELGAEAARALHHAHAMGVVHRDVKPSNLLLDRDGGIYVADFGLAQTRACAELTQTGELVGTLRYMSPEQAAGRRADVDRRTDVYSLGASLYELATLRPAFPGDDRAQLLLQIAAENPPRPSVWDRSTPHDLETILAKAMAKDPADRYGTAAELAEDLQRFARGEPILARRLTRRAQAWSWCRRHRAAAASLAAVVVLLTTLAAGGAWVAARQTRLAREAQDELAARTINQLYQDWFAGNVGRVREQLELHSATMDGGEEKFEWNLLRNLVQRSEDNVLFRTHDPNWPKFVKFSPDGRWLACGQPGDGTALYDFHERRRIVLDNDPLGGAADVAFTPDGSRLVTVSWRNVVNCREIPSGRVVGPVVACAPEFGQDSHGWGNPFELSPDGRIAALGFNNGQLALVDLETGTCRRIEAHGANMTTLAFFPDGKSLLTCASDGTVKVWDAESVQLRDAPPRQPGGGVLDAIFDASGTQLLVCHASGVRRWNATAFVENLPLQAAAGRVKRLALREDGLLATADDNGHVTLWDASTGEKLETLRGHEGAVGGMEFSPDGTRLVTTGREGALRLWPIRIQLRLAEHRKEFAQCWTTQLQFAEDGRAVTYCTSPYGHSTGGPLPTRLYRCDVATNSLKTLWETPSENYCSLTLAPDERSILCGGSAGLALRSLEADEVRILDDDPAHAYRHVDFSRDGKWLAGAGFLLDAAPVSTGFGDGVPTKTCFVALCRRDSDVRYFFKLPTTANTDRWRINALAFSPDGRRLFSGGGDGSRLSRVDEFVIEGVHVRHAGVEEILPGRQIDEVQDLTFARPANLAGMVVQAGYYRTWRLGDEFRPPLRRQRSRLHSIAVAPDGRLVALGSSDSLQLCDVRTGHPLATIPVGDVVSDLQFSPDGRTLAWASRSGRVEFLRTAAATADEQARVSLARVAGTGSDRKEVDRRP